jgi:hypothetical protein
MNTETKTMKSIWYLVGLVLLEMGLLVLIAGIVEYIAPSARQTVLAETHPGIWWGCVMVIAGSIFFFTHRK